MIWRENRGLQDFTRFCLVKLIQVGNKQKKKYHCNFFTNFPTDTTLNFKICRIPNNYISNDSILLT